MREIVSFAWKMPPAASRPNIAARYGISTRRRSDKPPSIPKWANWGWLHLPLATRFQIFAVFFGAVALTTPFWVYVYTDPIGYTTFGLWHFCIGDECTSIHDNVIPGRNVPGRWKVTIAEFRTKWPSCCYLDYSFN